MTIDEAITTINRDHQVDIDDFRIMRHTNIEHNRVVGVYRKVNNYSNPDDAVFNGHFKLVQGRWFVSDSAREQFIKGQIETLLSEQRPDTSILRIVSDEPTSNSHQLKPVFGQPVAPIEPIKLP